MNSTKPPRDAGLRYYAGVAFENTPGEDGIEQIEQNLRNVSVYKVGSRKVTSGSSLRRDASLPVTHTEVTDDYALAVFETSTDQPVPGAEAFRKGTRNAISEWSKYRQPIDEPLITRHGVDGGLLPSATLTGESDGAGLQSVRERFEAAASGDDVKSPETVLYHTFIPARLLTDRETAVMEQWGERIIGYRSPRYRIVDTDVSSTGVVVYLAPSFVRLHSREKVQKADRILEKIPTNRVRSNELADPEFWGEREIASAGDLKTTRDLVSTRLDELADQNGLMVDLEAAEEPRGEPA